MLLLFEYGTLNGGENSILSLIGPLRQRQVEFSAYCAEDGPLCERLEELKIDRAALPAARPASRQLPGDPQLQRLFDTSGCVLAHANSLAMARKWGSALARLGIPTVGHLRDILRLSRAAVAALNQNRRLLAVSQATLDWHRAQGLDPAKSFVAYNGVDLQRFAPRPRTGAVQRMLGLPRDCHVIVSIGQLGMRKGWQTLLQAFATVANARADVHLLAVGERHSQKEEAVQYETQLRVRASSPPLRGRVHFMGRRDDVPLLLSEADLLVHAARQEPLGRVLLEAAACGCPVIATEVGGTREIFPSDQCGAVLTPADDPAAMAERILELLQSPSLRAELGRQGRARMEAAFARETAADVLLDHYHATCGD